MLTACPSCTKIFAEYGKGLSVQTVYEVFQREGGLAITATDHNKKITVHDPCQLRDHPDVQSAVRGLLVDLGYTVVEMVHRGKTTVCCGEGGSAGCIESRFSHGWREIRRQESQAYPLVSYCAGCTLTLSRVMPTCHILDLLFGAGEPPDKEISVARGMLTTSINRLLLKRRVTSRKCPLNPTL